MSNTITPVRISRTPLLPQASTTASLPAAPAPSTTTSLPVPPSPVTAAPIPGDTPPNITHLSGLPRDTFALTFDDGPNPVYTPQVLATLREHGVKATFFVTGENATRYPELIRQIVAEGHELGNHTWNHPNLTKLSQAAIRSQLDRTQKAVDDALGYHYPLTQVRPPYGANNQLVRATIAERGASMVLWQIDSVDWKYPKDDKRLLTNTLYGKYGLSARGGVILFHDIHPQGPRVLDTVIRYAEDHHLHGTTSGAYLHALVTPQPATASEPVTAKP